MLTKDQREAVVAILNASSDLAIATVRADGWPQATTVSFVNDGQSIYFGTWAKSQKAANIARDARVSITVNAPYKEWNGIRGLSLAGHARRVSDGAELARVFQLMLKKFPQVGQFVNAEDAEMAIFRIDPEIVSILDYTQGFGHTELATA